MTWSEGRAAAATDSPRLILVAWRLGASVALLATCGVLWRISQKGWVGVCFTELVRISVVFGILAGIKGDTVSLRVSRNFVVL